MLEYIAEKLTDYQVILEPDEDTPEWWAGAPSVVRADDGTFYLAARMREGNSPRGRRGYEVRILKSADGRHFEPVHHIKREDAGVPGFERPALVRDPINGAFKLYGCAGLKTGWAILKFDDADDPAKFDPASARAVVVTNAPDDGFVHLEGVKDPVVFWDNDHWNMFVIGHDRIERIHHFVSEDGETWEEGTEAPFIENDGWHNFYTRPACVVPMAVGYLFVYEGSHFTWHDPVYNIATGLAYTPDLYSVIDLTPDVPLLVSTTPGDYHTWRYSHWLPVGDQMYVYFEAARPNNTNEIRLGVFDMTLANIAGR
ncbi:MAG TPA: hypothetical protein PLO37_06205 [Candidatus Hydrogenedentes bacterium]|nr:hypothetical protein [Candidatus Hydrogenedentota bacterium]HPG66423.1 hypothetical protein [Candidatus Hydrogenedentota bacterium]